PVLRGEGPGVRGRIDCIALRANTHTPSPRRLYPEAGEREESRRRSPGPNGRSGMTNHPMRQLVQALRQNGLIRFIEHFAEQFPDTHMKDMVTDDSRPDRTVLINGSRVVNFGSDSFLGLDQ